MRPKSYVEQGETSKDAAWKHKGERALKHVAVCTLPSSHLRNMSKVVIVKGKQKNDTL